MEEKGPSTKDKLASIVDGFSSFDTEMKIGTRQRREKDEFRIAELKMEMKRLDASLTAEVKKRTEMNKSTQTWIENDVHQGHFPASTLVLALDLVPDLVPNLQPDLVPNMQPNLQYSPKPF